MTSALRIVWLAAFLAACGSGDTSSPAPVSPPGPPKASVLNTSLASPWGMAFLPDGRMLVTQKGGSMVILSADGAKVEATVSGVPAVVASGQGGLLDVALDGEFEVDLPAYGQWEADSDRAVSVAAGLGITSL